MGRTISLLGLVVCLGCASLPQQMREATNLSCKKLLERHESLREHPDYAKQSTAQREPYEASVADCELSDGSPAKGLALARSWTDDNASARARVTALASAALGDDETARKALEEYSSSRFFGAGLFVNHPELHRFAGQEWYIKLGSRSWTASSSVRFETLVASITGVSSSKFLKLDVAHADPQRPPGAWVIWSGKLKNARFDRDHHKTILVAEGIDIERIRSERKVLVETVTTFHPLLPNATTRPVYRTERDTRDVPLLNGHEFVVEVPWISDSLAELRYFQVFGRYVGRSGEHPLAEAMAVLGLSLSARQ